MKKSETVQGIPEYHIIAKCNKERGSRVHCYKCIDEEGHEKDFSAQEIIDLIEREKGYFYTGSGDTKSRIDVILTSIRAHPDKTPDNNLSNLPSFKSDSN